MAKLTTKQRKALSASQFAIPSQRKYPIDTKNRARNALARVAQNGTAAQQAQVRKRVKAKFPSIGKTGKSK